MSGTRWVTVKSVNNEISLLWETQIVIKSNEKPDLTVVLTDCRLSLLWGVSLGQADHSQDNSKGFQREHLDRGILRDLKLSSVFTINLWWHLMWPVCLVVSAGRSSLFDDQNWTEQVWPMLALQAGAQCSRRRLEIWWRDWAVVGQV